MSLTKQQLFDKALFGVRGNKEGQCTEGPRCIYRKENGDRCAAGHLMTDEAVARVAGYAVGLGLKECRTEAVAEALTDSGVPEDDFDFVLELQRAHDWRRTLGGFNESMKRIAGDHFLTYTEPV